MPYMGTSRIAGVQRLQCRKTQRMVFRYFRQSSEKQRLSTAMKQKSGAALLFLKEMEDGTGSVWALLRNLFDSRTFSASISLQALSPSLVSSSPFPASPQQHSLRGKASHCPFSWSLLNLLFLLAKYPWKHIGEYCPETLPQLYVGIFPPKINWEGSQINSRYITEHNTQDHLAELIPTASLCWQGF